MHTRPSKDSGVGSVDHTNRWRARTGRKDRTARTVRTDSQSGNQSCSWWRVEPTTDAGYRANTTIDEFHVGRAVRLQGRIDGPVQSELVRELMKVFEEEEVVEFSTA
jgi:hypothetical protein